jgi:serine/threonine-protein kinase HipA
MKRRGKIYLRDVYVGLLEQFEGEYIFTYDFEYLQKENAEPISLSLPLTTEPYKQKTMIPFFDGLIPEGWLLDLTTTNWKVDRRDRMGLLLAVCRDCIGAVHVLPEEDK